LTAFIDRILDRELTKGAAELVILRYCRLTRRRRVIAEPRKCARRFVAAINRITEESDA
jgi:hypothetical protein